jgi:hypothetical protein
MKTTAKTDIVNYVLGLFATLVLLVAWPRGKKGGPQKWTKITAQDMADPAYLQKLAEASVSSHYLNGLTAAEGFWPIRRNFKKRELTLARYATATPPATIMLQIRRW